MAETDWSNLDTELLELILRRLYSADILHLKALCSSWKTAAESYIASPCHSPPWIIMEHPSNQQQDHAPHSFFDLVDNKFYNIENVVLKESDLDHCVAS